METYLKVRHGQMNARNDGLAVNPRHEACRIASIWTSTKAVPAFSPVGSMHSTSAGRRFPKHPNIDTEARSSTGDTS